MPYFQLKGSSILPNNAGCPVEVVSDSITTESADFFKAPNNNGRVELVGVTDSGYHLVTPDANTTLKAAKVDVFSSKLKINGVAQKYCAKGKAPLGSLLTEQTAGTYYFYRRYDGYCELQDSNESSLVVLSTLQENRKYFTIFICGGGGSGTSGGSGLGWWGGGGGGGAAGAVLTFEFTDLATTQKKDLKLKIEVGGGAGGKSPSGNSGSSGGATVITPVTFDSSFGDAELARVNGGGGGSVRNGGGYGSFSFTIEDLDRLNNSYYRIENYAFKIGGNGGSEASGGGGTSAMDLHNYSVISNYQTTIGGTSGGGKSGGGNGGGGGGASPFANGNGGYPGGGGHGGEGAFGSGKSSQGGGSGYLKVYY